MAKAARSVIALLRPAAGGLVQVMRKSAPNSAVPSALWVPSVYVGSLVRAAPPFDSAAVTAALARVELQPQPQTKVYSRVRLQAVDVHPPLNAYRLRALRLSLSDALAVHVRQLCPSEAAAAAGEPSHAVTGPGAHGGPMASSAETLHCDEEPEPASGRAAIAAAGAADDSDDDFGPGGVWGATTSAAGVAMARVLAAREAAAADRRAARAARRMARGSSASELTESASEEDMAELFQRLHTVEVAKLKARRKGAALLETALSNPRRSRSSSPPADGAGAGGAVSALAVEQHAIRLRGAPDGLSLLQATVQSTIASLEPTAADDRARALLLSEVQRHVRALWGARAVPFGSSATGLHLHGADLDVCVIAAPPPPPSARLEAGADSNSGRFTSSHHVPSRGHYKPVPRGRKPIYLLADRLAHVGMLQVQPIAHAKVRRPACLPPALPDRAAAQPSRLPPSPLASVRNFLAFPHGPSRRRHSCAGAVLGAGLRPAGAPIARSRALLPALHGGAGAHRQVYGPALRPRV